jgi:actin-like ATPase involved in cell morphogenesis
MAYFLGIDIGTTYTAAAVWRDGRYEIASLGNRAPTIPSVVLLRDDEAVLTGEAAVRRAATEPGRVAREFKRRIGDPTPIIVAGTPYSADALVAKLLRWVVDQVTAVEGGPPAGIAVSHPANWGNYKLDLLGQAIRLADLDDVATLTEPEAAAIHYASQERVGTGSVIAVYDLGGGTFDAAVLRKTDAGWDILGSPEGIERLGGVDFDAAVYHHVAQAIGGAIDDLDPDDPTAQAAVARLRQDCIDAKEALSSDSDVSIPVLPPNLQTEVRLTRPEYEQMIRPALADTITAMNRALRSAGVGPDDVTAVLLVGGSSRTPLVSELVSSVLGRPVAVDAHPKHGVALGAAITAAREALGEAVAGASGSAAESPAAGASPRPGGPVIAPLPLTADRASPPPAAPASGVRPPAQPERTVPAASAPSPITPPGSAPPGSAPPGSTPPGSTPPGSTPPRASGARGAIEAPDTRRPDSTMPSAPAPPVERRRSAMAPYGAAAAAPDREAAGTDTARSYAASPPRRGARAGTAARGGDRRPPDDDDSGWEGDGDGGSAPSRRAVALVAGGLLALALAGGGAYLALSGGDDGQTATATPGDAGETAESTTTSAPTTSATTLPPGPFVQIDDVVLDGENYRVEYQVFGYEPQVDGGPESLHVHFFLDTTAPENAGINGPDPGDWDLTDQPSFVTKYGPDNRGEATQMCSAVATVEHAVHTPEVLTGNCVDLPA